MTAISPGLTDPRLIYRLDAILSLTLGIALVALAAPLASLIGWPPMQSVLTGAGIFLLPWACFNWTIGATAVPDRISLTLNIAGDLVWAAGSFGLLMFYSAQMTLIGVTLIVAQALFVAGIGGVKFAGRRSFAT